jgi:hypothetical protein
MLFLARTFRHARFSRALEDYMRLSRFASAEVSDRCRRRVLRPQPFKIVEFTHLGSEHVHDHIAGIDQHPVAIGQALDMDVVDAGFLQGFRDVFRDRTDMPVNPAGRDDHVVGKGRFAAKVDGDRFFRLHIVEAGEDHIQRLVGVGLRLQGCSLCRCFTRGLGGRARNLG